MTQSLFPPEPKLTPMMEQYRSIQKTLPTDTILFFRLGDFYEMFFEDAARGSEILGITLTGREGGPAGRIPMCGIPHHAFQQYVRVLLDRNLKVAVCEQMGDPQTAKGLLERKVTRIITPATYLDEETKKPQAEYMLALAGDPSRCALAALDLGTGEFIVRETDRERLASELSLLQPREVVLSKRLSQDLLLMQFLKESAKAAVTVYEDWIFEAGEGARLLKEGFSLASERAIPFHDRPLAVGAAGALMYYLKDHLHSSLGHLRLPALLESQDFMPLDRQTVLSLELVSGQSGEKKAATLLGCLDQTLTPMGSRALHHWVTHPLVKLEAVLHRQEGTAELAGDSALMQEVRALCKGVRDVERTLSRLTYGVANARDLLNLKLFLERVPELISCLKNRSRPSPTPSPLRGEGRGEGILDELCREMNPFPEIQELIGRAIADLPPLTLREGGIIRDGYSAELDELRGLAAKGKSWLMEFERREIERTGIKSLRLKYNHVFGYAIEVSKPNLHMVPAEYRRKQTLANAERFVVPELQQWDEKISGAQEKVKELEYRLFQEVRDRILLQLTELQADARAAGALDALASLAFVAIQNRWARPQVSDSLELRIEGGRHPVVEAMLPSGQFVENDLLLDGAQNQLIVLTGPNMAGKSTTIRQAALITLMAQIGSFVPAKSARIGLTDRIFTRVGARDDLSRGESTFMVEMIEMAQILRSATGRSLLILDEVGRGTSTFDGVSLAWAICEHLTAGPIRPRTLFATHYHELIRLEEEFPGVKNYTVAVRETSEGIVFLRKMTRGGSDRSYGIHVARLAGVPEEVTQRAEKILKVLESENSEAVRIIEGKNPSPRPSPLRGEGKGEGQVLDELREELKKLELDKLTPLQALNALARLKEKA